MGLLNIWDQIKMAIGRFLNNTKYWILNAVILDCLYHCHINWNTSYNIQYLRSSYEANG